MDICRLLMVAALVATPALAHPDHAALRTKHQNRPTAGALPVAGRQWLPGDHHIHSEFSADYEPDPASPQTAPIPLLGKDGRYTIIRNAEMARQFGLRWMVSTDHGGPNHSKLNFEKAWPEVDRARLAVPEMLIFYGMEFDTPAGDHSSLIIPFTGDERGQLQAIEAGFSKKDPWPRNEAWDTEARMIDALKLMRDQTAPPVLIANHPSRSATAAAAWGLYTPAEFRNWNDTAPRVAIGMEGAPGHQAGALKPDGTPDLTGNRGGYGRAPTLGGFDQMTATLGGFWDSMLAESRRWFITATSDSHSNWRDGGNDFWPGEYAKTYVQARPDHADIIDGLRSGRIFVTTGDLVSEVDVIAVSGNARAGIGGTLKPRKGRPVEVTIRVRDPSGANAAGRTPEVAHVDLITGQITGPAADRTTSNAPGTGVTQRFTSTDWKRDGEYLTMNYTIPAPPGPLYLRVRGTSTSELEPVPDPKGENPWDDLWFMPIPSTFCQGKPSMRATFLAIPLLLAGCAITEPKPSPLPTASVTASGETAAVATANADAADDPAIWRNTADPAASLIVGTDKKAGLYVYGLDGQVRDFNDAGRVNNVDIATHAGQIIVAASDRNDNDKAHVALFRLDPTTAKLEKLGRVSAGKGEAYGICLLEKGDALYAFVVLKDGTINQLAIDVAGAKPRAKIVRTMKLGTQSEGCVVDARTNRLYVAEEDVGLWRFDAMPDGNTTPVKIAAADGKAIVADAEGLAIAADGQGNGGYLVVSSQGDNAYAVYRLADEHYVGRFRIAAGKYGATSETDGIEIATGDFGPQYPTGIMIAQDGDNAPKAQNFKLVDWGAIKTALGID